VGAILCALSAAVYFLVRHSLIKDIDRSINDTAALLSNQVELENGLVTFEWQEGLGANDSLTLEGIFQFWDENTGKAARSPALGTADLEKFTGPGGHPEVRTIRLPNGNRSRAVGLRVLPFVLSAEAERMRAAGQSPDPTRFPHTLVVACDLEPAFRTLARLRYVLISGTLLTLGLGFALIDQVIRVSLRPITDLNDQMRDRADHQLDSSLTVPGTLPEELTGLARSFDGLLARVAATRQRERDFIRHAAHELRTPIAGLNATTELALSKPRDAAEYKDFLIECGNSAGNLKLLVERLSALAKIGVSAQAKPRTEAITPGLILGECLPVFAPLAENRGLEFAISGPVGDLRMSGDLALCRIILNNLLDNAVCHSVAPGTVGIVCDEVGKHVRIRISNPVAVLPEDPNRWFEPLFRGDESGHNSGGHLGIGLTLSLEAARAMGGRLSARADGTNRITFTLELPCA
jgi:signal transduction histidine kinase